MNSVIRYVLAGTLSTWFGAGRLRPAPGTWGSLAALPFAWGAYALGGPAGVLLFSLAIFAVGCWASAEYVRVTGRDDPGEVVIDEVAGQCLLLAAVAPGLLSYALGFALFRLFDVLKPWPVGWADRRVKGGLGIMLDDMLAGALGVLSLWAMDAALGGLQGVRLVF